MSKKSKRRSYRSNKNNAKNVGSGTLKANGTPEEDVKPADNVEKLPAKQQEALPQKEQLVVNGATDESPTTPDFRDNINGANNVPSSNHAQDKTDDLKSNGDIQIEITPDFLRDFIKLQFYSTKSPTFAEEKSKFWDTVEKALPALTGAYTFKTKEELSELRRLCVCLKLYICCCINYQVAELEKAENDLVLIREFIKSAHHKTMVHDLQSPGAASNTSDGMNGENIVNSTSLEDVPLSISSERAQSIQSLHSAMSDIGGGGDTPTAEQPPINYAELLDQQKAHMEALKNRKEQLERAQRTLMEQLRQVEDTKKQHTSQMSFGPGSENGNETATSPNYESVDQVRGDMSQLAGRLSNITNFINNQNRLVNDIDERTGGAFITDDFRTDQNLLHQKVHNILAHRKDIDCIVKEIRELNTEASRRNGEVPPSHHKSPSVTPCSSTDTLKTIKIAEPDLEVSPEEQPPAPANATRVVPIRMQDNLKDADALVPEAKSLIKEKQSQIEAGRKYLEELKETLRNIEEYEEDLKKKQVGERRTPVAAAPQQPEGSSIRDPPLSSSARESITPTPSTCAMPRQKQLQDIELNREHDKNDYEQSKKLFNELCKQIDPITPSEARDDASAALENAARSAVTSQQQQHNVASSHFSVSVDSDQSFESYREKGETSQSSNRLIEETSKSKAANAWRNDSGSAYDSDAMTPEVDSCVGSRQRGTTSSATSQLGERSSMASHEQDSHSQSSVYTNPHTALATQLVAGQSTSLLDASTLIPLVLSNVQTLLNTVTQLHNFVWQQQREIDNLKSQANAMRQQICGLGAHSSCDMPAVSSNCANLRSHSMPPLPPLLPMPLQIATEVPIYNTGSCGHSTPTATTPAPTTPAPQVLGGPTVIDTSCNFANAPSQQNFPWLRAQSEQPVVTDFSPPNCGSCPRSSAGTGAACCNQQSHHQRHHFEQQSSQQQYQQQPPQRYNVSCQHFSGLNNEPAAHLNNAPNPISHGNAQTPHQQPIFMHHHNNPLFAKNANLRSQNLLQQQQQQHHPQQQHHYNSTLSNNRNVAASASSNLAHVAADLMDTLRLNNEVPPGNRANNYWDNFRSYSLQNLLSRNQHKNHEQQQMQARRQGNARGHSNLAPNGNSAVALQANNNIESPQSPDGHYNGLDAPLEHNGEGGNVVDDDDCTAYVVDAEDGATFLEIAYRTFTRMFYRDDELGIEASQLVDPTDRGLLLNVTAPAMGQSVDHDDNETGGLFASRGEAEEPALGLVSRRLLRQINESQHSSDPVIVTRSDFCLPLRNINVDKHNELAKNKVNAKAHCRIADYNAMAAAVAAAASAEAKDNALKQAILKSDANCTEEEPAASYKLTPKVTNSNNNSATTTVDSNRALDAAPPPKAGKLPANVERETDQRNSFKDSDASPDSVVLKELTDGSGYGAAGPSNNPVSELSPNSSPVSGQPSKGQSRGAIPKRPILKKPTTPDEQDFYKCSSGIQLNEENIDEFLNALIVIIKEGFLKLSIRPVGDFLTRLVVGSMLSMSPCYNVVAHLYRLVPDGSGQCDRLDYDYEDQEFNLDVCLVWLRKRLRSLFLEYIKDESGAAAEADAKAASVNSPVAAKSENSPSEGGRNEETAAAAKSERNKGTPPEAPAASSKTNNNSADAKGSNAKNQDDRRPSKRSNRNFQRRRSRK